MPVSSQAPQPMNSHSQPQSTTLMISAPTLGHITTKVTSFLIGERFELCTPCSLPLKVSDTRTSSFPVITTFRPPSDIPTDGTPSTRLSRMSMIWRLNGRTSRMIFSGEVLPPVEEVVLPVSSLSISVIGKLTPHKLETIHLISDLSR
jgi:hypothetical protein